MISVPQQSSSNKQTNKPQMTTEAAGRNPELQGYSENADPSLPHFIDGKTEAKDQAKVTPIAGAAHARTGSLEGLSGMPCDPVFGVSLL